MIKDYLGKSEYIEGIGKIYPISVVNYDHFKRLAQKYIIPDKKLFERQSSEKIECSLLEIIISRIQLFELSNNEEVINLIDEKEANYLKQIRDINNENVYSKDEMIELLKLILRCDIDFDEENFSFKLQNEKLSSNEINKDNFEKFREVVMRQNLLFAPLYYDDIILQSMLEDLRESNEYNVQEEIDLEAVLQIISIIKGINPWELKDYTYYQLMADFSRIQVLEGYDWVKHIQTSGFGSKDTKVPKIDKKIDLNKHPEEIDFNASVMDKKDEKIQER